MYEEEIYFGILLLKQSEMFFWTFDLGDLDF